MKALEMRRVGRGIAVALAIGGLAAGGRVSARESDPGPEELRGTLAAQRQLNEAQRQLNEAQELRIEKQRQQIEEQARELREQRQLLRSFQTRLDELAAAQGRPPETEETVAVLERLQKREDVVESEPEVPENIIEKGEFTGSIKMPGTNLAARLGGFVKLNMVSNFGDVGEDDRFVTASIPVTGGEEAGQGSRITFSARQSRLSLDLRMDSTVGRFRAFIEGDFAGEGGTDNYRLRHAYGQFDRFLIGQTWSTFSDISAIPETLDFEGLNARIRVRQALVQWASSLNLGLGASVTASVEDPSPDVTGGEGVSSLPDLAVRARRTSSWGHLQGSLLLRKITAEAEDTPGDRESDFGWGMSFAGVRDLASWGERDNLMFQLNFGEGIGRYINDLGREGGQDAVFDPETGTLRALRAFGGYVGVQHWWTGRIRSTLALGHVQVVNLDFQADDAYFRTWRASLNWIWSPITNVHIGAEVFLGSRQNKDGAKGTATQAQMASKFRF